MTQPYPHTYEATASAEPKGSVTVACPWLEPLRFSRFVTHATLRFRMAPMTIALTSRAWLLDRELAARRRRLEATIIVPKAVVGRVVSCVKIDREY
jgi:hypothetical protein